jgi:polysaccharide pyruvyl transferase WcaK-like protein
VTRDASAAVLVCGWYGTETLGDKAILGGIVRCIRSARNDAEIDVASLHPYVTQQTAREMPQLRLREVIGLVEAREQVRRGRYAAVVIGGGPLMSPVRATIDLLELFANARSSGSATLVGACGVGPLTVRHRNEAIAGILTIADIVAVRDEPSAHRARHELGVDRDMIVVADPAFYWLNAERSSVQRTDTFLFALRDWESTEYAATSTKAHARAVQQHFDDSVRAIALELLDDVPGARIVPFCMHKHPIGGDDRSYFRRVFASMPQVLQNMDMRHRPPTTDLQAFLEARAVLAMRFHSIVFAVGTATPFVAIDYTGRGKTDGLLGDLASRGIETEAAVALDGLDAKVVAQRLVASRALQNVDEYVVDGERRLTAAFHSVLK